MNTPSPQEYPTFVTRTVQDADGTRITVAHKPGALDHVTDEELLAENARIRDDYLAGKLTEGQAPTRGTEPDYGDDNVRSLAAARLRRHPPGEPFTPDMIAPLLIDPTNTDAAAEITAVLNHGISRLMGRDQS
ncbi:hypothetical protein ABZ802_31590 [Streptomyces sp. NPDC047737]|uniref:hypothetical protein n=1 Tax=Streptomyces sp. NPDC047737 TaxID=3155740 RepID=UPI0033EA24AE